MVRWRQRCRSAHRFRYFLVFARRSVSLPERRFRLCPSRFGRWRFGGALEVGGIRRESGRKFYSHGCYRTWFFGLFHERSNYRHRLFDMVSTHFFGQSRWMDSPSRTVGDIAVRALDSMGIPTPHRRATIRFTLSCFVRSAMAGEIRRLAFEFLRRGSDFHGPPICAIYGDDAVFGVPIPLAARGSARGGDAGHLGARCAIRDQRRSPPIDEPRSAWSIIWSAGALVVVIRRGPRHFTPPPLRDERPEGPDAFAGRFRCGRLRRQCGVLASRDTFGRHRALRRRACRRLSVAYPS